MIKRRLRSRAKSTPALICSLVVAMMTYFPYMPCVQLPDGSSVGMQVLLVLNGQSSAMGWSVLALRQLRHLYFPGKLLIQPLLICPVGLSIRTLRRIVDASSVSEVGVANSAGWDGEL